MIQFKPFNREMGIAATVFVVLMGLSLIPQLTVVALWLLPAPIIAFALLQSKTFAGGLAVIAGLILVLSGFGWFALLAMVAFYFLAWAVTETLSHENASLLSLITMTLVFIMLELVLLALAHWSGFDIFASLKTELSKSLADESALLGASGLTAKQLLAQSISWLKMMFPALVSIVAVIFGIINLLALRWLLREKVVIPPILRVWRLPYSVLVVYLLSLVLILLGSFHSTPWLWQSLHNIEFIGAFLIGIEGISFIWRKVQSSRFRYLILILLMLLAIIQLISMVYVVLGVLDILNESRRPKQS